jgi:hypothetical protein
MRPLLSLRSPPARAHPARRPLFSRKARAAQNPAPRPALAHKNYTPGRAAGAGAALPWPRQESARRPAAGGNPFFARRFSEGAQNLHAALHAAAPPPAARRPPRSTGGGSTTRRLGRGATRASKACLRPCNQPGLHACTGPTPIMEPLDRAAAAGGRRSAASACNGDAAAAASTPRIRQPWETASRLMSPGVAPGTACKCGCVLGRQPRTALACLGSAHPKAHEDAHPQGLPRGGGRRGVAPFLQTKISCRGAFLSGAGAFGVALGICTLCCCVGRRSPRRNLEGHPSHAAPSKTHKAGTKQTTPFF